MTTYTCNFIWSIDFRHRHELALAMIGGFSSRVRGVASPKTNVMYNNVRNVCCHRNKHMNAKRVRRCQGHSTFQPDGKDVKETVYGCFECGVCETHEIPRQAVKDCVKSELYF